MKSWLERNEIYFKTIAAVLLSAMAIVISVTEVIVVVRQNQILAQQRDVAAQALSPQFIVSSALQKNDKTNYFEEEIIFVYNEGKAVRDIKIDEVVVLSIKLFLKEGQLQTTSKILLNDYFFAGQSTGNRSGLIYTIYTPSNNRWAVETRRDFYRIMRSTQLSGELDFEKIIKVSYQAISGEKIDEFFLLNQGSISAQKLPFKEGSNLFFAYQNIISDLRKDISELDAHKIVEIARKSK